MLDSLLTLTLVEAGWLLGAFILTALLNRGITLMIGTEEPVFLVIAAVILVVLIVKSTYTAVKWAWHRLRSDRGAPKA